MIATYSPIRRRMLDAALTQVLTPLELTMVRELARAEDSRRKEPQAEDLLYWIRLNMPSRAHRVDAWLNPRD